MPMLTTLRDPLARCGRPTSPERNAVCERGHPVEHLVHVGDDVLPVDDERRASRGSRSAVCRTARSSVTLMWSPRNIASIRSRSSRLLRKPHEQRERLVGDPVLRVVEIAARRPRRSSRSPRAGSAAKSSRRCRPRELAVMGLERPVGGTLAEGRRPCPILHAHGARGGRGGGSPVTLPRRSRPTRAAGSASRSRMPSAPAVSAPCRGRPSRPSRRSSSRCRELASSPVHVGVATESGFVGLGRLRERLPPPPPPPCSSSASRAASSSSLISLLRERIRSAIARSRSPRCMLIRSTAMRRRSSSLARHLLGDRLSPSPMVLPFVLRRSCRLGCGKRPRLPAAGPRPARRRARRSAPRARRAPSSSAPTAPAVSWARPSVRLATASILFSSSARSVSARSWWCPAQACRGVLDALMRSASSSTERQIRGDGAQLRPDGSDVVGRGSSIRLLLQLGQPCGHGVDARSPALDRRVAGSQAPAPQARSSSSAVSSVSTGR